MTHRSRIRRINVLPLCTALGVMVLSASSALMLSGAAAWSIPYHTKKVWNLIIRAMHACAKYIMHAIDAISIYIIRILFCLCLNAKDASKVTPNPTGHLGKTISCLRSIIFFFVITSCALIATVVGAIATVMTAAFILALSTIGTLYVCCAYISSAMRNLVRNVADFMTHNTASGNTASEKQTTLFTTCKNAAAYALGVLCALATAAFLIIPTVLILVVQPLIVLFFTLPKLVCMGGFVKQSTPAALQNFQENGTIPSGLTSCVSSSSFHESFENDMTCDTSYPFLQGQNSFR
uniref:DRHM n=1 Tax=Anaplasma phagocytophilum TaxID=948 RepID=A0A0A0PH16_ANAPH|nr:DRHM [Anaplasma phagocytophilum]